MHRASTKKNENSHAAILIFVAKQCDRDLVAFPVEFQLARDFSHEPLNNKFSDSGFCADSQRASC